MKDHTTADYRRLARQLKAAGLWRPHSALYLSLGLNAGDIRRRAVEQARNATTAQGRAKLLRIAADAAGTEARAERMLNGKG